MRPTEKKLRAGDVSASKEETKKLLAKGLIENMTAASTSSREASMRMNNALVEQQMQFDKNVLPYHKAIVETIRGGFPILNGCTSESMIKLGLSRALLEQNPASNLRFVENKEKKRSQQGPDLKLFKRQSYHIAIAYHIHLRNVRSANVS